MIYSIAYSHNRFSVQFALYPIATARLGLDFDRYPLGPFGMDLMAPELAISADIRKIALDCHSRPGRFDHGAGRSQEKSAARLS